MTVSAVAMPMTAVRMMAMPAVVAAPVHLAGQVGRLLGRGARRFGYARHGRRLEGAGRDGESEQNAGQRCLEPSCLHRLRLLHRLPIWRIIRIPQPEPAGH